MYDNNSVQMTVGVQDSLQGKRGKRISSRRRCLPRPCWTTP